MGRPIVMEGYDFASAEKRRLERSALRARREQSGDVTPRATHIERAKTEKVVHERAELERIEREKQELNQKLRLSRSRLREGFLEDPIRMSIKSAMRGSPELVFPQVLKDASVNWDAAKRASISIRNPEYSLKMFYDDMVLAFPELKLYMAFVSDYDEYVPDVDSGMTASIEYRRTVGALFAVYWLARIGIDGAEGFSYGVDEDWVPRMTPADENEGGVLETPQNRTNHTDNNRKKRKSFHDNVDWIKMQGLLVDANILSLEDGKVVVNDQRVVSILALTAFHDIMKVEALKPCVAPEKGDYHGYAPGVTINDHDLALGYVLEHYSEVLPTFNGLPREEQLSVAFTQAKMNFNHGWLVQAEAPPDALFTKFKHVIDTEGVEKADVAFYFVHWLTDLAGAHPSPLEGSVKFVLQFPQPVLASFINSFSVLNELANKTETQVFEDYIVKIWRETAERGIDIGPVPDGDEAIAKMRLMIQCQTREAQEAIVKGFDDANPADRAVLAAEMARTGLPGQHYSRGPPRRGGPAFLVYYSPALVRTLVPKETPDMYRILAEVYRRARELFPAQDDFAPNQTVSIRVDQLKEHSAKEIYAVHDHEDTWVLVKRNDLEAVVERRAESFIGSAEAVNCVELSL